MHRLKRSPIAFAGVAALIAAISLAAATRTKGQGEVKACLLEDVNVVNKPDVNIANTPTVSLAEGTGVRLNNGADDPVPVRNVENAKQPFQKSVFTPHMEAGESITDVVFTVPADKRLVLEFVSVSAGVPTGQDLTAYLQTQVGSTGDIIFPIVLTNVGASSIGRVFNASQPIKLYADPGTVVRCAAIRSSTANIASSVGFSLAGYLVDVPSSAPQ